MPEISVILSVYNPNIDELLMAVDSILNQTFSDFELLLYDDGSDINYVDTLSTIANRDDRIRFIRSEDHHSLAYGLNYSIGLCRGRYIARMDGDDISEEDRLEREYTFLEEHPEYDYVGSNISLIDNSNQVFGKRLFPEKPCERDFLKYQPYAHPSLMFRREILNTNKPYGEDEMPRRGEDYELLMRLHSEGHKGYNIQDSLLKYRETLDGYKRRAFKYQIQEVTIRWNGFRKLGLYPIPNIMYVIKPVLVWMVPNRLKMRIKRKRNSESQS